MGVGQSVVAACSFFSVLGTGLPQHQDYVGSVCRRALAGPAPTVLNVKGASCAAAGLQDVCFL
jgi:hypothetical protein